MPATAAELSCIGWRNLIGEFDEGAARISASMTELFCNGCATANGALQNHSAMISERRRKLELECMGFSVNAHPQDDALRIGLYGELALLDAGEAIEPVEPLLASHRNTPSGTMGAHRWRKGLLYVGSDRRPQVILF